MPEKRAVKAGQRVDNGKKATRSKPRLTEDEILAVLKEEDGGAKPEELSSRLGISLATLARWRARYGALRPSEARRLKQLEEENRRLRSLVADLTLSNQALKLAVSKKW